MLLKNSGLRLLLAVTACCLAAGLTMADVTAPARIGDLAVDKIGADASMSWTAVALDAAGNTETVASYNIYRGETKGFVADKIGGSNRIGSSVTESYLDVGALPSGMDYYYRVTAVDGDGNEGGSMMPLVTTPPVLSGNWTDTTIDLTWTDAQPVGEVTGYRVYCGEASGQYDFVDDVGLVNGHTIAAVLTGVNWYCAVAATDANGNESAFSNEHIDVIGGVITVRAHDEAELCWGAAGCPVETPETVVRSDGFQKLVPVVFPEGDWTSVEVTYTIESRLCSPPTVPDKCTDGNPGGYNPCGDPWDRIAHLFMVLDDCIAGGGNCITQDNMELMRAITPFGTDAPAPDGDGIVPPSTYTLDITPFAPLLTGTRHIGAQIVHYVQTGWWVTVDFRFSKRAEDTSPKPPADGIAQVFFHTGANMLTPRPVTIPASATQVFTRYFISGHGSDEFVQRLNRILVNDTPAFQTTPWVDCCYPRGTEPFCPDCADWNACGYPSCTFDRSGWCPGEIACHYNQDQGCNQDLDATGWLPPGGTYNVTYDIIGITGSWPKSLVAYWYNDSIEFCGNNNREGDEFCDGTDLDGESCQTQGFDAGALACAGDCTGYDTSNCRSVVCGDTICDSALGEDCITCDLDCNGVQSGNPANQYCCGAGGGDTPVPCTDPRCNAAGNTCE